MRLDDLFIGDARKPLKSVDVLREARVEQLLLVEEANERVGERRPEFSRIELVRKVVNCPSGINVMPTTHWFKWNVVNIPPYVVDVGSWARMDRRFVYLARAQ